MTNNPTSSTFTFNTRRDWLVWSSSAQGLFSFACCLFQDLPREDRASQSSQLARSDAAVKDNWRKLYEKIEVRQGNSHHITCYLTWKDLEKNLNELVGIDSSLQKQFASKTETAKWREIFRCILEVVLFLAERNLPVCGSTIKLDDPNNIMDFSLGIWSYLVVIIKCLKSILMRLKNTKRLKLKCKHTISQGAHRMSSLKVVINASIEEVKRALYYSIILDGTPDTSHTKQITFIVSYTLECEN